MKKKYFFTISIIILGILALLKINVKHNNTLAVYIDNDLKNNIPNKADNLYINKIDCDNDATATWDNDNWGLFISNLSKKAKCNLYFIHDNEKPYWQIESVEKVNVLSTDILEFKIAGTDFLGNVSSNLDISNLSFYVNDELESPIKVELTKLEELNKKITYSIKVHMVGGAGNLKVKISSGTLTDTSNNQNAEITLDTGINVSKNPTKIFLYSDSKHAEVFPHANILDKFYESIDSSSELDINNFKTSNYNLIIFDFEGWYVPTVINKLNSKEINILSYGNDTTSEINIIKSETFSDVNIGVGDSYKVTNNSLTDYLPEKIAKDSDNQYLIKFSDNVNVLYKNKTKNIEYDSIGYIKNDDKIWLHYQIHGMFENTNVIPIIQFTLGELK